MYQHEDSFLTPKRARHEVAERAQRALEELIKGYEGEPAEETTEDVQVFTGMPYQGGVHTISHEDVCRHQEEVRRHSQQAKSQDCRKVQTLSPIDHAVTAIQDNLSEQYALLGHLINRLAPVSQQIGPHENGGQGSAEDKVDNRCRLCATLDVIHGDVVRHNAILTEILNRLQT